jgi:Rab-GTPase-TBC domain
MHSVFKPGFPGLLEGIYVQERLLETLMPEVYKSFVSLSCVALAWLTILLVQQKHMISSTSYATKWYITLFANSVPFQTQLRIWDAFLLEGRDVIIVFAVAILWSLRGPLLHSALRYLVPPTLILLYDSVFGFPTGLA